METEQSSAIKQLLETCYKDVHWPPHRCYIDEHNACSALYIHIQ